jgi:hypothetical protein
MVQLTCPHCGAVNDYTTSLSGPHLRADCNQCKRYIKFLPQETSKPILYFGKYKGREISSMNSQEELNYLKWLFSQSDLKPKLKADIEQQLKRLNQL